MEGNLSIRASAARIGWMTQVYICAGTGIAAQLRKRITSSYDGSFLNVFYACELQFYDVSSFYHKA